MNTAFLPTVLYQSFPQFSRLPAELRSLVWKAAHPEPRLVQIAFTELLDA